MRKIAPAALAALLLAVPAQSHAARGMQVAVQDDMLLLYNGAHHGPYMDRALAYRRLRGLNVSRIRMNVIWRTAVIDEQREMRQKPRQVQYKWWLYDEAIAQARRHGMRVHLTLTGPGPAWATPRKRSAKGHVRPNVRQYRAFVKDFAQRYRGQVDRFSLWNEPNWHTWLAPHKRAPLLYRRLYRAGFKAVRKQAPRAQVLVGELSPNHQRGIAIAPLKFLRQMTCVNGNYRKKRTRKARRNCRGRVIADGMAHHPYDFRRPPWRAHPGRDNVTIATLGRLNRALTRLQRARVLVPRRTKRMPVHLTEYGYIRAGQRRIPEKRRARWTRRAFKIARRTPRVRTMLNFTFVRPPGGIAFDMTLLNTNGKRTPTFKLLRKWTRNQARRGGIKRPGAVRPR